MNFAILQMLAELKAIILHPICMFIFGAVTGFLGKLAEIKVRSGYNRSEKLDESVARILDNYAHSIALHYDAWLAHQKGTWINSPNESRDKIEQLSRASRKARLTLQSSLNAAFGKQLDQEWTAYYSELTGDGGLIMKKSDKIIDSSLLDTIYAKHVTYIASLRVAIYKGKAT